MARYARRNPIRKHIKLIVKLIAGLAVLGLVLPAVLSFVGIPDWGSHAEEQSTPAPMEEGTPVPIAAPSPTVEEDTITDHLTSRQEVKTYSLEMAESGDVLLFITGLQETWDGYTLHWLCTVYKDDPAAPLVREGIRGYSVNSGPTLLALPKLETGMYHIRMEAINSGNPFMTAFTSDPYQIHSIKYYHSSLPVYAGDGIQTFQYANEVLWAFDGTGFLKANDGACFGVLMKARKGAIVPVLISKDAASVEYMISSTGQTITAQGPFHHELLDEDYYYSGCEDIKTYTEEWVSTSSLPILYMDLKSARLATEKVLDELEEEQYRRENGELKFWLRQNKVTLIVAGVIVLIALLAKFRVPGGGGGEDYEGAYLGRGDSFLGSRRERSFTEGGPTGCGIGGSFCGFGRGI